MSSKLNRVGTGLKGAFKRDTSGSQGSEGSFRTSLSRSDVASSGSFRQAGSFTSTSSGAAAAALSPTAAKAKASQQVKTLNTTDVAVYVAVYYVRFVGSYRASRSGPVMKIQPKSDLVIEKPEQTFNYSQFLGFSTRKCVLVEDPESHMWDNEIDKKSIDSVEELDIRQKADNAYILEALTGAERKFNALASNVTSAITDNAAYKAVKGSMSRPSGSSGYSSTPKANPSRVRAGITLSDVEMQALKTRRIKCKTAIEKLLGRKINEIPTIAIAASGGGNRAMVSMLGQIKALDELGIMDCVQWMCGLSGSTWGMAQWYGSGRSLQDTIAQLPPKLEGNWYQKLPPLAVLQKGLGELKIRNQDAGIPELFGMFLDHHMLRDLEKFKGSDGVPHLSVLQRSLMDGSMPLPIFTTVCREVDKTWHWVEMSPFEVAIPSLEVSVPMSGFGMGYDRGLSESAEPEPTLGMILATCGTAFCANMEKILHEVGGRPGQQSGPTALLGSFLQSTNFGGSSFVTPPQFQNFTYGLNESGPFYRNKKIQLMDAGIHFNLPFPPLLRRERGVDIILCLDNSAPPDIDVCLSLRDAKDYAEEKGLPFPELLKTRSEMDDWATIAQRPVTVFKGDGDVPTIIYIPMMAHEKVKAASDATFCPRSDASAGGFCSTFNFTYTEDDVATLSKSTYQNVMDSGELIKSSIRAVIDQKDDTRACISQVTYSVSPFLFAEVANSLKQLGQAVRQKGIGSWDVLWNDDNNIVVIERWVSGKAMQDFWLMYKGQKDRLVTQATIQRKRLHTV